MTVGVAVASFVGAFAGWFVANLTLHYLATYVAVPEPGPPPPPWDLTVDLSDLTGLARAGVTE